MWLADQWKDYELLDCSDGERLERWGKYILIRPDPQVIWRTPKTHPAWKKADAHFIQTKSDNGSWTENKLPQKWITNYGDLKLKTGLMNFKHPGIFPEQAANWDFTADLIRNAGRPVSVLNLFGYTGAASLAAAAAGASVCHVDAIKGMNDWGKESAEASGLQDRPIRWIADDCRKFVRREITRGRKYDGIVMDPPPYGRGPKGELWRLEEDLAELMDMIVQILSDRPLFFILNSYATSLSPSVGTYLLSTLLCPRFGGRVETQELGLPVTASGLVLPCGCATRWTNQ